MVVKIKLGFREGNSEGGEVCFQCDTVGQRSRVLELIHDHGSEYGKAHRHARVRRSNDNAHIERFNRTAQEECFDLVKKLPQSCKKALRGYLPYYNNERPHLGIEIQAPAQMVRRY